MLVAQQEEQMMSAKVIGEFAVNYYFVHSCSKQLVKTSSAGN